MSIDMIIESGIIPETPPYCNPDKSERILCAAIWYQSEVTPTHKPKNINKGLVLCGRRHHDCISTYFTLTGKTTKCECVQGFITSSNKFVNREEAASIAYSSGQIAEAVKSLFSEDLY